MTKTTNKTALNYALENLPNAPADVREKWQKMIEQIDKKNAAPRKLTEKQEANEVTKETIQNFLREHADTGFLCADLGKQIPALEGMSPQKISALLHQLKIAGLIETYTEKRRTYFKAVQ